MGEGRGGGGRGGGGRGGGGGRAQRLTASCLTGKAKERRKEKLVVVSGFSKLLPVSHKGSMNSRSFLL